MRDNEKYEIYLDNLSSACERRDCLLIRYYHNLLVNIPGYNPDLALKGLQEAIIEDLGYARDCAVKRDFWSMKKDLELVRISINALESN